MTVPVSRTRPGLRSGSVVALLAALVALLVVAPVGVAQADDPTIGIAGGPASASGPDGRDRFSYPPMSPGQAVTDSFVVRNTGSTDQTVTVYGADAYTTNDGAFALLGTDETSKDAGTWVTFDGKPSVQVTLAPAAQQILPFTVTVPAEATPGDHAAGVVVSAQSVDGGVKVDRRVATRLYVRVAGTLQPALTVGSISARQAFDWNPLAGPVDITVTVRNNGNVALAADVDASVEGWFGSAASATQTEELSEMLPGTTREVTFRVASVSRWGYLKPVVTLRPRASTDAGDIGEVRAVSRDTTIVSPPWLLIGGVVVLVGLVLGVRWRRRRLTRQAHEWAEYTKAQALEAARAAADAGEHPEASSAVTA
jgi:dihydroorotate dehydrogenase (fumarate)